MHPRATIPLLTTLSRPRVAIVSGSFGAGHDAAARRIATELTAAGFVVTTHDVVDAYPAGVGRLFRWGYLQQLRRVPTSWGTLLGRLERPGPLYRAAVRLIATASRGLQHLADADLVVSTHPFASQALGQLRSLGRLSVPVVTYLTDMSVHPLWVHPAVDLHLALHPLPARQARALGARTAVVTSALTRPLARRVVRSAEVLTELRARLGLPNAGPLALVTGGAEGIGDLERSAEDIAATGLAHPVVLCGHNDALRHRLADRPGLTALGWRDNVPELLSAMDVVVQNAGGFTSQQAMDAGVPQLSYRCLPGHGVTNAAALEAGGLVPWARDLDDLPLLLTAQLTQPTCALEISGGSGSDEVLDLADVPTFVHGADRLDRVPA